MMLQLLQKLVGEIEDLRNIYQSLADDSLEATCRLEWRAN